jgi:poly [ADP-ribose] polymerase 1
MNPMHKIEPAPTGRAACRGCKKAVEKGTLRFCEEFQNPYSEDGGTSYRYWHLGCAAVKLANEVAGALGRYEGPVEDRESIEALVREHMRPEMPYAERAGTGRAKCRVCDETIKKDELRVAFERVFEGPMGPQKGPAYVHPKCAARYLEREIEQGREAPSRGDVVSAVTAHSKVPVGDLDEVVRQMTA